MSEGERVLRDGCRPNLEGVKEEDVTVVERRTVACITSRRGREGVDFMIY